MPAQGPVPVSRRCPARCPGRIDHQLRHLGMSADVLGVEFKRLAGAMRWNRAHRVTCRMAGGVVTPGTFPLGYAGVCAEWID